jgi:hypothetical protein
MCVTWTEHYACGCDEAVKEESNGCGGGCTGNNISYDDSRDVTLTQDCPACVAARSLKTPPTSSDSSASETSDE